VRGIKKGGKSGDDPVRVREKGNLGEKEDKKKGHQTDRKLTLGGASGLVWMSIDAKKREAEVSLESCKGEERSSFLPSWRALAGTKREGPKV